MTPQCTLWVKGSSCSMLSLHLFLLDMHAKEKNELKLHNFKFSKCGDLHYILSDIILNCFIYFINNYYNLKRNKITVSRWLELTALHIWSLCELNVVMWTLRENLCTPCSGKFLRAHEHSSQNCCST